MHRCRYVVAQVVYLVLFVVPSVAAVFPRPYGVNDWDWPGNVCDYFRDAGITHYRVMLHWPTAEPSDNSYNWNSGNLNQAINAARTRNTKLSLCVYDSPAWARTAGNSGKVLGFNTAKHLEFILAAIQYCESQQAGIVAAVEIENEYPTGAWIDNQAPAYGTDQRDPSWFYASILRNAYTGIKAQYPNMPVIMDGIWVGAYHHLDELYQLGCKDYFDRINLHHYTEDTAGIMYHDPTDTRSVLHFPTTIKYLKRIAEENGDQNKLMWVTEFGWRQWTTETQHADYVRKLLDICRLSGFVDHTDIYLGADEWDKMALIDINPFRLREAYYVYVDMNNQYPTWDSAQAQPLTVIPGALNDVLMVNGGIETGTGTGWLAFGTADASQKHSGSFSARQTNGGSLTTQWYPVEADRLYEIVAWVKISAANSTAFHVGLQVGRQNASGGTIAWESPLNYWGLVDTRNYPGTWRRVRFLHRNPSDTAKIAVSFTGSGTGTFWVDDVEIRSLELGVSTGSRPNTPTNLQAEGRPTPSQVQTFTPRFSWTFSDPDAGNTQSAYQVLAARSRNLLESNVGDLMDTGRVNSTANNVLYTGPTQLYPGVTYYWKVYTWDNTGRRSPSSPIASWVYVSSVPAGPAYRIEFTVDKTTVAAVAEQMNYVFRVVDAAGNLNTSLNTTATLAYHVGATQFQSAAVQIIGGMGYHTGVCNNAGTFVQSVSAPGLAPTSGPLYGLITHNRDVTALAELDHGATQVQFPAGTFTATRAFGCAPLGASETAMLDGAIALANTGRELWAYDPATGVPVPASEYRRPVTVRMTYPDYDNDGVVDGSGLSETGVNMYRYDPAATRWSALAQVGLDTTENVVTGSLASLGKIVLGASLTPTASAMLYQNFPNPFDPDSGVTRIKYNVPGNGTVSIRILTLTGEEVARPVDALAVSGPRVYETRWDGRNRGGGVVSAGTYLCRMEFTSATAGGTYSTRKIVVIKR